MWCVYKGAFFRLLGECEANDIPLTLLSQYKILLPPFPLDFSASLSGKWGLKMPLQRACTCTRTCTHTHTHMSLKHTGHIFKGRTTSSQGSLGVRAKLTHTPTVLSPSLSKVPCSVLYKLADWWDKKQGPQTQCLGWLGVFSTNTLLW